MRLPKHLLKGFFVVSLSSLGALGSCIGERPYDYYIPVYADAEVARNIHVSAPKAIENPGNIFTYNNFLIVNIKGEGIHVLDNTDPSTPINKSFINIPGNSNVAIKDGMLFADNYVDLVAFTLDENNELLIKERFENVITNAPPYASFECVDPEMGIVIGWEGAHLGLEEELPNCGTE